MTDGLLDMLEDTINRLQERIRDSRLKDVVSVELTRLLADKPPGVRCDEYITAAAVIILKELKSELVGSDSSDRPCPGETPTPAPLDCETIVNGLLIGMHHDLLESNLQMVKALGSAIAERDYGTSEHNFRVTIYSVRLAESVKLEKDSIQALIKGSFLHDIGKIGIRDNTLLKPGQLSEAEYEDVKRHVLLGRNIIGDVRWLEDAVGVVLHHHERWDGRGYPHGLAGEDIPLNARIFTVADVFDALTSTRPYKAPLTYSETMAEMIFECGKRFDPVLFKSFTEISEELYTRLLPCGHAALEDILLKIINQYFHFSPAIDDLRDSFGSIARRDEDPSRA